MPELYFKQRYLAYISVLVILLVLIFFLKPFDHLVSSHPDRRPPPGEPPQFGHPPADGERIDILSLILFAMVWSLSAATKLIRRYRDAEQAAARAEIDRARAELSFLKAQINPHFLFNTLNNIYSLAEIKSDQTSTSILRLSNIMRYVTDDAMEDFVSLQREIDCIQDYIDLQRLRLSDKVAVNFAVSGELGNREIAPLLLMTFVENVFKYGISNHERCEIILQLFVTEKAITFYCENKIFPGSQERNRTGTGIVNAKRRLGFLYPGRHILNIENDGERFKVTLTLQPE